MRRVQLDCEVNQGYSQRGIVRGRLFWQGQLYEGPSNQYTTKGLTPAFKPILDFILEHSFLSTFFNVSHCESKRVFHHLC